MSSLRRKREGLFARRMMLGLLLLLLLVRCSDPPAPQTEFKAVSGFSDPCPFAVVVIGTANELTVQVFPADPTDATYATDVMDLGISVSRPQAPPELARLADKGVVSLGGPPPSDVVVDAESRTLTFAVDTLLIRLSLETGAHWTQALGEVDPSVSDYRFSGMLGTAGANKLAGRIWSREKRPASYIVYMAQPFGSEASIRKVPDIHERGSHYDTPIESSNGKEYVAFCDGRRRSVTLSGAASRHQPQISASDHVDFDVSRGYLFSRRTLDSIPVDDRMRDVIRVSKKGGTSEVYVEGAQAHWLSGQRVLYVDAESALKVYDPATGKSGVLYDPGFVDGVEPIVRVSASRRWVFFAYPAAGNGALWAEYAVLDLKNQEYLRGPYRYASASGVAYSTVVAFD